MKVSFVLKETFPVPPESIYDAWLNGDKHSEMTGGKAICSSSIGGKFSCWDGYITGMNKSLVVNE
ncbi:MAG: hypothetical protein O2887_17610 [Bacteroidetes bacterium]|nr:hypothetical protein [Bacteroidota bacterium]MDA1122274.1 hypothetical protein [Bacteroidota bacterium]